MINSDNNISRSTPKGKETIKPASERPEGKVEPDKFREVYAMNEKKRFIEDDEDDEEVSLKKKKGDKSGFGGSRADLVGSSLKSSLLSRKEQLLADDDEEESSPFPQTSVVEETKGQEKESKPSGTSKEFSSKIKYNDKFVHERPDLASVNPFQAPMPIESNAAEVQPAQPAPAKNTLENLRNLQVLFDKIADEALQVKQGGETSTYITLNKENGIFSEANIKISESDTAKGQLNITIDNLRPDAKVLIDNNQSSLMLALERKGYQLQMLITTTEIEIPHIDTGKDLAQGGKSKQNKDEDNPHERKR